jgi:hypothetical protein
MAARFRLRRFLYLDEELTDQFLGQLEGGLYDEEAQSETTTQARKRGGGVKVAGAHGEVSKDVDAQTTASRTVRRTGDANFSRLAAQLEEAGGVQFLEAFDDGIWEDLRRGEVLEVEASVTVPLLVQLGLLMASAPVEEIAEAFGEKIDAKTAETMEQMGSVMGLLKAVPVIGEATGASRFKFIALLSPDFLRVSLDDLSGDVTIFATLDRKLKQREKWSVLDAMGLGMLPRSLRKDFERSVTQTKEFRDMVVTGPAAVVSPIALYR